MLELRLFFMRSIIYLKHNNVNALQAAGNVSVRVQAIGSCHDTTRFPMMSWPLLASLVTWTTSLT